jgi:hypothetical protein
LYGAQRESRAAISKSYCFERNFELACFRAPYYTSGMSEHSGTSYTNSAFIPFVPVRSREAIQMARPTSPNKPSIKRSAVACAFLLFYVAAYLGVGFAGIAVIERAWLAIIR